MNKKVSLILTTFNSKSNLTKTLASIENQDYSNVEVIIKDGLSSDGTRELISEYKKNSKYNVISISCKDSGIYDAMNQGYFLASGEYILFFNDAFIVTDAISSMVSSIECNPECVGCHSDLIYEKDGHTVRYWKMGEQKAISAGWMPGHPTLMLRREIYERYGLYRDDYIIAADYEFMVRILNENKISYIPRVLIVMFYGGTSNKSFKNYVISFLEGNRALGENGYRFCLGISILRIIRVLLQFRIRKLE